MTYETAIGMFDAAQTGDELLQILDSFVTKDHVLNPALVQQVKVPTLEPMEF
jgi:hypothetical protein